MFGEGGGVFALTTRKTHWTPQNSLFDAGCDRIAVRNLLDDHDLGASAAAQEFCCFEAWGTASKSRVTRCCCMVYILLRRDESKMHKTPLGVRTRSSLPAAQERRSWIGGRASFQRAGYRRSGRVASVENPSSQTWGDTDCIRVNSIAKRAANFNPGQTWLRRSCGMPSSSWAC
jgi:hypothetical protein